MTLRPTRLACAGCGARLPIEDEILLAKEQTTDNNQVAQVVLRQSALAQVPLLGEVHVVLQRRRAARA